MKPAELLQNLPQWRIKKGFDRRFSSGHPWVFSNELQSIDKNHPPGELAMLCNPGGEPLAIGFGNPHSLFVFREVSRNVSAPISWEKIITSLIEKRNVLGLKSVSARICFGEADGIPGFVLDRFVMGYGKIVYVAQYHSAGADRNIRPILVEILQKQEGHLLEAVIEKNDLPSRAQEGLKPEEPQIVYAATARFQDTVEVVYWENPVVKLEAKIVSGQKTGLFLDQRRNQLAIAEMLKLSLNKKRGIQIADLFSYVGAWGVTLGTALKAHEPSIVFADASEQALELAQRNARHAQLPSQEMKQDLVESLEFLKDRSVDVLVCDPPAFVKKKTDLHAGLRGYTKLFSNALNKVKDGGWFVACSCSSWVSEEDFQSTLAKAEQKSGVRVSYVYRGGLSEDHPVRAAFPEGNYLKCWAGLVARDTN